MGGVGVGGGGEGLGAGGIAGDGGDVALLLDGDGVGAVGGGVGGDALAVAEADPLAGVGEAVAGLHGPQAVHRGFAGEGRGVLAGGVPDPGLGAADVHAGPERG